MIYETQDWKCLFWRQLKLVCRKNRKHNLSQPTEQMVGETIGKKLTIYFFFFLINPWNWILLGKNKLVFLAGPTINWHSWCHFRWYLRARSWGLFLKRTFKHCIEDWIKRKQAFILWRSRGFDNTMMVLSVLMLHAPVD